MFHLGLPHSTGVALTGSKLLNKLKRYTNALQNWMRCQEIDFQKHEELNEFQHLKQLERQEVHMVTEMSSYVLLFLIS